MGVARPPPHQGRAKGGILRPLTVRAQHAAGVTVRPGRDPGETRARPGPTGEPGGDPNAPQGGPCALLRPLAVTPHTLQPLAGALQGTRGARKAPRVRPKAPSRGYNGASSLCARVLAGSHPGPDRVRARREKGYVARTSSCVEASKRPNTDAESHLVSPVHRAAAAQAPQTPHCTRRGFFGVRTVVLSGVSDSEGWRDNLVTSW